MISPVENSLRSSARSVAAAAGAADMPRLFETLCASKRAAEEGDTVFSHNRG